MIGEYSKGIMQNQNSAFPLNKCVQNKHCTICKISRKQLRLLKNIIFLFIVKNKKQ